MRLIDADKLLKDIMSQKILGDTTARTMDKYINVINNQPTAYNTDKVVEELEEMKTIDGSMKTKLCIKFDEMTVNMLSDGTMMHSGYPIR